jgi:signal transduction histidine kinase
MAQQPPNAPVTGGFSIRSLIRYGIALQTLVIVVVLAMTLWGALQTRSKTGEVTRSASAMLLMSGQNQEFARARIALRQYALAGSQFSLGAFNQSKSQITTITLTLQSMLSAPTADHARELTRQQFTYLNNTGALVIKAVRSDDLTAARGAITSRESLRDLKRAHRTGTLLAGELAQNQDEAERAADRRQTVNIVLVVLAALLILLASIGVLGTLGRKSVVPLEELAVASRRLGHGDLSARVEPGGVKEIALTGAAFNQMADEIERHVGQLHELTVARSRFVSSVSHELRTPITSLRGYLDLLANGEAGELSPDQLRFIEVAERNARQLSELIDDLLTLSRVQSERLNLRDEPVNVRDLLHDLKAELLPIGSDRGIDIVLVDTGELIVRGDRLRLRQAFGNLLSNAIKYSRDDQVVVVRALTVGRQAVISFVDWGMGIPREDLPQIAEPFFRSEANSAVQGTGLGLAIAKQMIELHGGRLAVESELGSGSTFTVYLPLVGTGTTTSGEAPPTGSATTTDD